MRTLLTSDMLFGRPAAAEARGFESTEHMDDALVAEWNSKVRETDAVYHLGNFAWDPLSAEAVLPFLNGTIFFVMGLYDTHMPQVGLVKSGRHHVVPSTVSIIKNKRRRGKAPDIVISHWPMLDWPGRADGVMHAHGGTGFKTDLSTGRRFSVCCDRWDFKPVEMDALTEFAETYSADSDKALKPAAGEA